MKMQTKRKEKDRNTKKNIAGILSKKKKRKEKAIRGKIVSGWMGSGLIEAKRRREFEGVLKKKESISVRPRGKKGCIGGAPK